MSEAVLRPGEGRILNPDEEKRVVLKNERDAINRPVITYWKGAWLRLKKNPVAMFALVLLAVLIFFILFGPSISGKEYVNINASARNLPPSSTYWFGTDALGRDLFSRVWVGARLSLVVALVCAAIQLIVGCAYGGVMAYFGGKVDTIMMRILEVLNSFPSLLVTLLIMMIVGKNVGGLLFAMCITSWIGTARTVRGQVMQLRESDYVQASRMLGASPARIIVRHLIPNIVSLLVLDLCTSIPDYIFEEASLSFLGMGLSGDVISLGVLISDGKAKMQFYPWQLLFPAGVLVVAVLAFNLLGDGLRDALDPRAIQ